MNTSFYIARRYLFAKKSTHAINIISGISAVGVFVGSAALIIILSVFNGFEGLVLKMYNTFTPQILISPAIGKTFDPDLPAFKALEKDGRVWTFTEVLAENAVLKYRDKQAVGLVKGVSADFMKNKALDSIVVNGQFVLQNANGPYMVVGAALQNYLMINTNDPFSPVEVFSPNKDAALNSFIPTDDFTLLRLPVSGVYEVQQDFDNIAIVPISVTREMLHEEKKISSIEVNLQPGVDADRFKSEIQKKIGADFEVRGRLEQNRALYNVLSSEKWMVYFILTFIVVIAIFNIIGSLTMLVIEKIQDINVLNSLGAGKNLIRRIFLYEGMMITLAGCVGGLIVGWLFCLAQAHFGWVKMGEGLEAYPVSIKLNDFILVFITVYVFSFIASALASRQSVKYHNQAVLTT